MIRFPQLEQLGISIATFSEKSDGDCRIIEPGICPPGRARICQDCGIHPSALVLGRQVHGISAAICDEQDRGRGALDPATAFPETDALITRTPGLPLAILVADCAPVFIADPIRRTIGIAHAGRAGTFANICGATVAAMRRAFDCAPAHLHALIGPSAGPEKYEVSPELAEEWTSAGYPASGRLLDLWETNRRQLEKAGIPSAQITLTNLCTLSDDRFFSHRRGAAGARNMALIML